MDITKSILFEPAKIKNNHLRDRFVRSATYDGCADKNGHVTEKQMDLYTALAESGFDALEISQGLGGLNGEGTEFRTKINVLAREAYFRNGCRQIKNQVDVPVMMVGRLRTCELMEEIIQKQEADLISLSRPLIREPGIINEWKRGDRHRAKCISCNHCFEGLMKRKGLRCFQEERRQRYSQ